MITSKTPLKKLKCAQPVTLKEICRTCAVNIPISGRGRHNIFEGAKSLKEKVAERLTALLGIGVIQEEFISSIICSKCKRELEKLEKVTTDLESFKSLAERSAEVQMNLFCNTAGKENQKEGFACRVKRCKGNSPSSIEIIQTKKRASLQPRAQRNILSIPECHDQINSELELVVHDDLVVPSKDKPKSVKVEVRIDYPSKPFKRNISDEVNARIIRGIATKENNTVANAVWESADIRELLLCKVEKEVKAECSGLCSQSNPSMLKDTTPASIIGLKDASVVAELKERAPILERVLRAVVTGRKRTDQECTQRKKDREKKLVRAISTATSVLLKCRNSAMAAMSYRLSLLLWHGGAEKQLFTRLCKWGLSMGPWSTSKKVDAFGENFDGEIKKWKECLEASNNLESLLHTIQSIDKEEVITTSDSIGSQGNKQTINTSTLKDKVKAKMSGMFNDEAYFQVTNMLGTKLSSSSYERALDIVSKEAQSTHTAAYQIIGDNIDMLIKVKHMSSTNQNNSIHWFNLNAVLNRVLGNHLNNEMPIKSVLEVENSDFLPSAQDNLDFLHDLVPLVARVAVTNIPALSQEFKAVVVWHIPHMYSKEMSEPSQQVPLGLLFKNENINEDMIDILQELHNKYLPLKKFQEGEEEKVFVCEKLFFGGDQLTDERARHSVDARSDGDNTFERLEGFLPKCEDWHAVRILYQVLYDIFYKPKSGNDVGTMCSNLNVINNVNARTSNVLDNFNQCKGYTNFETDVFITAAIMKYFGVDSLDASAEDFIPPNILNAAKDVKRKWLHKHVETMLVQFMLADQQKQHDDIRDKVAAASRPQPLQTHYCTVCGKEYRYAKARNNHMKREHPDVYQQLMSSEESTEPNTPVAEKTDDHYNYARLRLSMGLLIRNFDDSIKEGDGGRTLRCWKFALLLFRAYNHTKYALAALQLQACVQAMLTPRLAHSLTWNRTVNTKGGQGKNIPLDLRLEHLNNMLKGLLKHLGPNMTESAAMRCSKSIDHIEQLLESVDSDLQVKKPHGHHKVMKSEADFKTLVKELTTKGDVFSNKATPERRYQCLSNFRQSLLQGLDFGSLNKWITNHKKQFYKLEPIV